MYPQAIFQDSCHGHKNWKGERGEEVTMVVCVRENTVVSCLQMARDKEGMREKGMTDFERRSFEGTLQTSSRERYYRCCS